MSDSLLNDRCAEVQARVRAGESLDSCSDHLSECPPCQELAGLGPAAPGVPALDLDAGFAGLQAELAGETGALANLRAWPTGRRRGLLVVVAGVVLAAVWAIAPWGHLEAARAALSLTGLAAILLVALWQSLRPIHQPSLPSWLWWGLVGLAVAFPFAISALPAAFEGVSKSGGVCFGVGCIFGLPVLLLGFLLNRAPRGAAIGSGLLLALAAGGALGGVTLDAHCGTPGMLHRLASHGALAATWVGIGLVGITLARLRATKLAAT
ncbi:MAG: hypothetical protein JKY65_22365 [Planctomycetes bacterium]|nr:hypothetical protein [Planctomycetota bacterium]